MVDLKSKAQEVKDHGYCVIESAYDDQECEGMRAIFDALCEKKGGLSADQPSVGFHPLLEWGPRDVTLLCKIGARRCDGRGVAGRCSALAQRGSRF